MKQKLKINSLNLFYLCITILLFFVCEVLFVSFNFTEQSNAKKNDITYQTTNIVQSLSVKLQAATANYVFYALDDDFNEIFEKTKRPYTLDYIIQTQYVKNKIDVVLARDSFLADIGFAVDEKNVITVKSATLAEEEMILEAATGDDHSSNRWYTSPIYFNQSLSKNEKRFFLLKDIVGLSTKEVVAQMALMFPFANVEDIILENQKLFRQQTLLFAPGHAGRLEIAWQDTLTTPVFEETMVDAVMGMQENYHEQEIKIGHKTYYAVFQREQTTDWVVMSYYDVGEVFWASIADNMLSYLGVSLVFLAVLWVQVNSFRYLNMTVRALRNAMIEMKHGNFVKIDLRLENETLLKDVVSGFNEMSQTLEETIYEQFIAELARKEAELRMLHFQINPHFLYNSLNSIQSLAVLYDVPAIASLSENMARLFQYNMQPEYAVTVQAEIDLLKQYYAIQNVRFPNKTSLTWDVAEPVRSYEIGKFTLQPIFENIFKHTSLHKGKVEIKVSAFAREDACYQIQIWNAASGLAPEEVADLNRRLATTEKSDRAAHIGMRNVNRRIKLQYGEEYGIFVESEENAYFCVNIILPIKEYKPKEEKNEHSDC